MNGDRDDTTDDGDPEDATDETDRDPFGRLPDSADDQTGDPFEDLEEALPGDPTDSSGEAADGSSEASMGDVGAPGTGPDRGDPFGEGGAFESRDSGGIDEDRVWDEIADAQAQGSVRDASERDYAEVSKHAYCERCEYVTAPPDVGCTHDGTEILEFVDVDTVRVVDCPIVAQRQAPRRRDSDSE